MKKRLHNPKGKGEALIDGDILVYRTGFAGQQSIYTARSVDGEILGQYPNKTAVREDLAQRGVLVYELESELVLDSIANVFHSLDLQLESIFKKSGCRTARVFLTGKDNFREQVATTAPYKGNRVAAKPVYYADLRERMVRTYGAEVIDGMEADDAISIAMWTWWRGDGTMPAQAETVACSIDKDLLQIPGLHLNWDQNTAPVFVDEDTAEFNLWKQTLSGDPTDNIPGIKGIGPEKAAAIIMSGLTDGKDYETIAIETYQKHLGDGSGIILGEMHRLVRLLRSEEELETARQGDRSVQEGAAGTPASDVPAVRQADQS